MICGEREGMSTEVTEKDTEAQRKEDSPKLGKAHCATDAAQEFADLTDSISGPDERPCGNVEQVGITRCEQFPIVNPLGACVSGENVREQELV